MKNQFLGVILIATLIALIAFRLPARAEAFIFNEDGTAATVTGASQVYITNNASPGSMMFDPSGGIHGRPVLVFDLGPNLGPPFNMCPLVAGDIALVDVNNGGSITHLLRFYNDPFLMESFLIFYAHDGSQSPADVGLPAFSNAVQLINQGPQGTSWGPDLNQPGYGLDCGAQPVGAPEGIIFITQFPASSGTVSGPLQISRSTNGVSLSWPTVLNNGLYSNTNLAGTNWVAVTNSATTNNKLRQVTLPATAAYQVFKLQ